MQPGLLIAVLERALRSVQSDLPFLESFLPRFNFSFLLSENRFHWFSKSQYYGHLNITAIVTVEG